MANFSGPCLLASTPAACFKQRRNSLQSLKFPWDFSPCENCKAGVQNAISEHAPEPGFGPKCIFCGFEIDQHKTRTGKCVVCSRRGNTNKGNRKNRKGVKAYWGYRYKANKIIEYRRARRSAA